MVRGFLGYSNGGGEVPSSCDPAAGTVPMIGLDPGAAPAKPFENWNLNEPERSTSFTMGIVGYVLLAQCL